MRYSIEINQEKMAERFDKCAKGAAAHMIAQLAGYGLSEDDLANAMDDIPSILMGAVRRLLYDIENWPGDYMEIVEKPDESFGVMLDAVPLDRRISVIKVVREITGLDLKAAKEMVEAAPIVVKENILREEAGAIAKTLEIAGGIVSLRTT